MLWNKSQLNETNGQFKIKYLSSYITSNNLLLELININLFPIPIYENILLPIENLLNFTDYQALIENIQHFYGEFYSDFLSDYDAKMSKDMGVVNTPEQVIDFIVQAVDYFLREKEWRIGTEYIKADGILDKRIFYLDPASGTMGFTANMMKFAYQILYKKISSMSIYQGLPENEISSKVKDEFNNWIFSKDVPIPDYIFKSDYDEYRIKRPYFLENVSAFEILLAPYIIGFIRTLLQAEELGAHIDYNIHRPNLYLYNTLMSIPHGIRLDENDRINWSLVLKELHKFLNFNNLPLRKEIETSFRIRHDHNIMVIWGNPPYNVSSQNDTAWINELIKDYMSQEVLTREEGKPPIKEITGLKSMNDDAIKFHRFAQWKICKNIGQGIVAYISNGYFIDGLAARGMRRILREVYDEIWVLNLYGNKDRLPPNTTKDENVFGNKCGRSIAITFMIRYPPHRHVDKECKIMYSEITGSKEEKLHWLKSNSIQSIEWVEVRNRLDHEFTPLNVSIDLYDKYNAFPPITDLFYMNGQALITGRDSLVINVDKNRLIHTLERFYNKDFNNNFTKYKYKKNKNTTEIGRKYSDEEVSFNDSADWNITEALKEDKETVIKYVHPFLFRAFDIQYINYYLKNLTRPRFNILQYLLPFQENIALIVNRGMNNTNASSLFITETLTHNKVMEGQGGQNSYVFPLLINYSELKDDFNRPKIAKDTNINQKLKKLIKYRFSDDDLFYYVHAILQTPMFRNIFNSLITQDFPRIPFPNDKSLFSKFVQYGKKLAILQLVKYTELITNYSENKPIYNLINDLKDENPLRMSDTAINTELLERMGENILKIGKFYFEGEDSEIIDSSGNLINYKIYFNHDEKQVFWIDGISRPCWEYEVGGKQIIKEWLNIRQFSEMPKKKYINRHISVEELTYLRLMISSIKNILNVQNDLNSDFKLILDDLLLFSLNDLKELNRNNTFNKDEKLRPKELHKFKG